MNKSTVKKILIGVLGLAVYLIVALVPDFNKDIPQYWIAFGFGLLALAALFVTVYMSRKGGTPMSKFYGFPLLRIGIVYTVVQVVLSIIVMALGNAFELPVWIELIVFLVLFLLAAIGFLSIDVTRDQIEAQDARLKANTRSIRALQGKMPVIAGQCADPETKKLLNALAEKFRYSDPVSCEAVAGLEDNLNYLASTLQSAVVTGNFAAAQQIAAQMESLLAERNQLCKLNK